MEAHLNGLFASAVRNGKIPAVAAIALDRSGKELYKGVFGSINANDASAPNLTESTPMMIWSCTKLATSVAALQLLERGLLSLADPVEKFFPKIKEIEVLDHFDSDGKAVLRPPKTKPTILHLMTHTTGFTYSVFDARMKRWEESINRPPDTYLVSGTMEAFTQPLMFDPGTKYSYGPSTDWLGFVIQAITGQPLQDYITQHILEPLGMRGSGLQPQLAGPTLKIHVKNPATGKLAAMTEMASHPNPEVASGGGYLYSSLADYSTFLLAVLNGGMHPQSRIRILQSQTVEQYLFRDQIPFVGCSHKGIGVIATGVAALSNGAEFLPGTKKGWSCGMLLNLEDVPGGRRAFSGSWAGLANLYYWIDPVGGKLGLVMTSLLPFMDETVLGLAEELERVVFEARSPAKL